jgi:hypothetical protein
MPPEEKQVHKEINRDEMIEKMSQEVGKTGTKGVGGGNRMESKEYGWLRRV